MEKTIPVGIVRAESRPVTEDQLACRVGSGTARVFATPCLAALMEAACMHLVQPYLEAGIGTVGTALHIAHTAPTPLGMTVTVEAVLLETDGPPVHLPGDRPGRGRPHRGGDPPALHRQDRPLRGKSRCPPPRRGISERRNKNPGVSPKRKRPGFF